MVLSDLSFAFSLDWEIHETLCVSCPMILIGIYGPHSYIRGSGSSSNPWDCVLGGAEGLPRFLRVVDTPHDSF